MTKSPSTLRPTIQARSSFAARKLLRLLFYHITLAVLIVKKNVPRCGGRLSSETSQLEASQVDGVQSVSHSAAHGDAAGKNSS